jgi:hypothetical protein
MVTIRRATSRDAESWLQLRLGPAELSLRPYAGGYTEPALESSRKHAVSEAAHRASVFTDAGHLRCYFERLE